MNRIKQLRKQKNMKQEDLAEFLNVQRSAISKYETEKVPLTAETLKKLSEIFDVTVDYILCNTNNPKATKESNKKEPPFSREAQLMYDSLVTAGINPEELSDEDFRTISQFIRNNKELLISKFRDQNNK